MTIKMSVTRLDGEPDVQPGTVPDVSDEIRAQVREAQARIAATPGATNGRKLLVSAVSGPRIRVYETRYAERLTHGRLADARGRSPLGLGSLACRLWLQDSGGRVLLMRHAAGSMLSPGVWDLAPGGGVEPGMTVREAMLQEADEELGLAPDQLLGLAPVALCRAGEPVGCCIIYRARLAPGALLHPNAEVAELRWHQMGTAVPEPFCFPFRPLARLITQDPDPVLGAQRAFRR